jgi:chorismate mutase
MTEGTAVRALRGATTVDEDTVEQIAERTQELLKAMMSSNGLEEDDIISLLFTATNDVVAMFPATAARSVGFGAVPLLCAAEIAVPGAMPHCIRVMAHINTTRSRQELHHVYLHGAHVLRDDLPD